MLRSIYKFPLGALMTPKQEVCVKKLEDMGFYKTISLGWPNTWVKETFAPCHTMQLLYGGRWIARYHENSSPKVLADSQNFDKAFAALLAHILKVGIHP